MAVQLAFTATLVISGPAGVYGEANCDLGQPCSATGINDECFLAGLITKKIDGTGEYRNVGSACGKEMTWTTSTKKFDQQVWTCTGGPTYRRGCGGLTPDDPRPASEE